MALGGKGLVLVLTTYGNSVFTIVNGKLDLGEFELAIDFDSIGTLPTWNVLLQLGMSGSLPHFFLIKVQIMVLIG